MRLIRWVEGRISGRKSRLKDGSSTSAADQFVYHPSPYRKHLSHKSTPAHNPIPKLDHQLEVRLNEQINQRLSIQFAGDSCDQFISKSQNNQTQLRRTSSALESRSKPKRLFDRANERDVIEKRHTQYEYIQTPCNSSHFESRFDVSQSDPYSLPSDVNLIDNKSFREHHPTNKNLELEPFEIEHQNEYQNEFSNKFNKENQLNLRKNDRQKRFSSIMHTSNESAFFDFSSSSLAQDCNTPLLGKQRSRIKTNPWLPSPWMSSNSVTNSSISDTQSDRQTDFENYELQLRKPNPNQTSVKQIFDFENTQQAISHQNFDENGAYENERRNQIAQTVRTSLSFASTSSSDSGCNVNTNSMDASVMSASNLMNESLMSCSLTTANSGLGDDDDDEEQILTICHNSFGEMTIANQVNIKHYVKQNQQSNNFKMRPSTCDNFTERHFPYCQTTNHIALSATIDDFGDMSSRAESQLSVIYQQIDELKKSIDEIDSDNNRIEAKIRSLINQEDSKVNFDICNETRSNACSTRVDGNNCVLNRFCDNVSSIENSSSVLYLQQQQQSHVKIKDRNYTDHNIVTSSEEEVATSSSYSPASSSCSTSSPTSIPNSSDSSFVRITDSRPIPADKKTTIAPSSLNNSNHTSFDCWSPNVGSGETINETEIESKNDTINISTIRENKTIDHLHKSYDNQHLERMILQLKQSDGSRILSNIPNGANLQKLLLNSRRRSFNSKLMNLRCLNASKQQQQQKSINRLSNGSIKNSNCTETWVSTATDLLLSSDEELDYDCDSNKSVRKETFNYANYVNNRMTASTIENEAQKDECNPKQVSNFDHLLSNETREVTLSSDFTRYNQTEDVSKFGVDHDRLYETKRDQISKCESSNKSLLPKPLTPFKKIDSYKRLKPINGSKIPVMKPIFESEPNSPNRQPPPSPAPPDRQINHPSVLMNKRIVLPKPKAFLKNNNRKPNNVPSCMISSLTQQLKFEKQEQSKLNSSFRKQPFGSSMQNKQFCNSFQQKSKFQEDTFSKATDLQISTRSPIISSDSGLSEESHSDHSPLVELAKDVSYPRPTLAHHIANLRLELRDVIKVAVDDVRKDYLFC